MPSRPEPAPRRASGCTRFRPRSNKDATSSRRAFASRWFGKLQARFPTHTLARLLIKDGEVASPQMLASFDESRPALLPRADLVSRNGGADLESWDAFAQAHAARLAPVTETGGAWYLFTPT